MKTPRKFNYSKEWFIENYLKTDNSLAEIARLAGCSYSVARKWMFKYGITPKPKYRKALSNLILYQSGNKPWNKGLGLEDPRMKKAAKKSGETRSKRGTHKGNKHPSWKGKDVKYKPLHKWISYWKGKATICIKCGSSKHVEWANISGNYKRDLTDFFSLCKSCHTKFDNKRRREVNKTNV